MILKELFTALMVSLSHCLSLLLLFGLTVRPRHTHARMEGESQWQRDTNTRDIASFHVCATNSLWNSFCPSLSPPAFVSLTSMYSQDGGVTVVCTSNRHPDDLYLGGINRSAFLPFIDVLKERCTVYEVENGQDHRYVREEREREGYVREREREKGGETENGKLPTLSLPLCVCETREMRPVGNANVLCLCLVVK